MPLSKLDECSFKQEQYIYRNNNLSRIFAGIKRMVDGLVFNKLKLFDFSSFVITASKASCNNLPVT